LETGYVQRLAAGDLETERHFFVHFGGLMRAMVHTRTRGRPGINADDVIQETFARVVEAVRKGRLRDADRFGAFVVGIFDRVLLEQGRSHTREHLSPDAGELLRAPDNPEGAAASREGLQLAGQVLSRLSERDRAVLVEVFVHDADKDDVCTRFQVTRNHLRVLLHRAKERFLELSLEARRRPSKNRGDV
jgi:RNA polymerase sigma-70 factor (ECF subfamily)